MCFSLSVIRSPDQSSECSSCHQTSTNVWIGLQGCMGEKRTLCISCANQICASLKWKHYDLDGNQIDPPKVETPKKSELTDLLIDVFNLRNCEPTPTIFVNVTNPVTMSTQQIGMIDFESYLAVHIHQIGSNGRYSTNASRGDPAKTIENMTNDKETRFLLDFELKCDPSFQPSIEPSLNNIKKKLDANTKIYDDAMSNLTKIMGKYADSYGRIDMFDTKATQEDLKQHENLGKLYNHHLYLPQTSDDFIIDLKFSDNSTLSKLPKLVWRVTQIEMDYDNPSQIGSMTISALF